MPVYRLDLAYDGSGFRGYAKQPGARTVQGELESALHRPLPGVETTVAGRTDAGVHADGQVVSFQTEQQLNPDRLRRSLNKMLNPEIAVKLVSVAPDGFDARFSARSRTYRYRIVNAEVLDPHWARRAWHVGYSLDLAAMEAVSPRFLGTHDFASFCRAAEGRATERTVLSAQWRAAEDHLLDFEVGATSFCHQMVRSLVAACVEVGRGRISAEVVSASLDARDRTLTWGAAPPHGLTLWHVGY